MYFIVPDLALGGSDCIFTVEEMSNPFGATFTEETELRIQGVQGQESEGDAPDIWFRDIGGMDKAKRRMKELVDWPLNLPDAYKRLGMDPPKGILVHGPSGVGKTMLVQAAARESGAYLKTIHGPEVSGPYTGS